MSSNTNDKAVVFLRENKDKINWNILLFNSNDKAKELLRKKQDKTWQLYKSNRDKLKYIINYVKN